MTDSLITEGRELGEQNGVNYQSTSPLDGPLRTFLIQWRPARIKKLARHDDVRMIFSQQASWKLLCYFFLTAISEAQPGFWKKTVLIVFALASLLSPQGSGAAVGSWEEAWGHTRSQCFGQLLGQLFTASSRVLLSGRKNKIKGFSGYNNGRD